MKRTATRSTALSLALLACALAARGDVSDYDCEDITSEMGAGWPASAKVYYWHKDTEPKGKAWTICFDLTDKHYRFTTRLGRDNIPTGANRLAKLSEMAEKLVGEGRLPLAGINGNYFTSPQEKDEKGNYSKIDLYGGLISNYEILVNSSKTNLFVETAAHEFSFEDWVSFTSASGRLSLRDGRRVRNATEFFAAPSGIRWKDGEYWPPAEGVTGMNEYQDSYPRSLIGIGSQLGHPMLVMQVCDGRQADWSAGVMCEDAVRMMVELGCHTVAANDGGGSAGMWISNLPAARAPQAAGYINKPSDGSPRAVAAGLFMLWDDEEFVERVKVYPGANPYPTMDEALEALAENDRMEIQQEIELRAPQTNVVACSVRGAGGVQTILVKNGAEWCVGAPLALSDVEFRSEAGGVAPLQVDAQGAVKVSGTVRVSGIETYSRGGFVLNGLLAEPIVVDCKLASEADPVFGEFPISLSEEALRGSLDLILHPSDPTLVAARNGDFRNLKWAKAAVRVGEHRYEDVFTAKSRVPEAGDTMELLMPMTLSQPLVISTNCTLTAATPDPGAAVLTAKQSNLLTVNSGARLLLRHVVLSNAVVQAVGGATVAVASDVGVAGVRLSADSRFELAGPLTAPVVLDTSAIGVTYGTVFGFVAEGISPETAREQSALILNKYDDELIGEIFEEDGRLLIRWGLRPVGDEEATVWFFKGGERWNFASLRMLLGFLDGDAEVFVGRDCPLNQSVEVPAGRSLRFTGAGDGKPVVTVSRTAAFVVRGELSVTNLCFDGLPPSGVEGRTTHLFDVFGKMTLERGAELRQVRFASVDASTIFVEPEARLAMQDGSWIHACRGAGSSGVAVAVSGAGTFDFEGGTISACESKNGAVYAKRPGSVTEPVWSVLNVSGSATVFDNLKSGGIANVAIPSPYTTEALRLVGPLTGRLGLTFPVNRKFGRVDAAAGDEAKASAANIVCDADSRYVGAAGADGILEWTAAPLPPVEDVVRIGEDAYPSLAAALAAATNGAVLELLRPIGIVCSNSTSFAIDKSVTLRAADPERAVVSRVPRVQVTYKLGPAIEIAAPASVTFENIILGDDAEAWPSAFVKVDEGASLTLGDGAVIRNVKGAEFYNDGDPQLPAGDRACAVFAQGGIEVLDGSVISNCVNTYAKSFAGGIFVAGIKNDSLLDFTGGLVTDCVGGYNGGVTAFNGGRVRVGGNGKIAGNRPGNLLITGPEQIQLVAPFGGQIGHTFGGSQVGDPNIFAWVRREVGGDFAALPQEALHFTNDVTGVAGVAATNAAAEACYIWRSAFLEGETYVDTDGTAWSAIGEVPLRVVAVPVARTNLVYNGKGQSGVDPSPDGLYELSGDLVATNPGTYTVTATLVAYRSVWVGGSVEPTNILWSIAGDEPEPTSVPAPTPVAGLVYDGEAKTGVVASVVGAYVLDGNVATNAGEHAATATLCDGYAWPDGSTAPTNIPWQIAKARYRMPFEIVFTNCTYVYDGVPKFIPISYRNEDGTPASLPQGVQATISYTGDDPNVINVGAYTAQVTFTGSDTDNFESISEAKAATLTIIAPPDPPEPPPEPPAWTVETNYPSPIAFKSISRIDEKTWQLVVTNREPYCRYRLIYTDDLKKGFVHTDSWEKASGDVDPVWTTNIIRTGAAWFWRAEGTFGTNMVPPQVEN